jgi:hypothetical protein
MTLQCGLIPWKVSQPWLRKSIIKALLILLSGALFSCDNHAEETQNLRESIWDKFEGRIVAASNENIFVLDSKRKLIDTIVSKPSYINYQIYGAFGLAASYDNGRIIYSAYGGFPDVWGKIFSVELDGSSNESLTLHNAIMLSSADENNDGLVAYATGNMYMSVSELRLGEKVIYDFSAGNLGLARHTIDWHPQEDKILLSLTEFFKENYLATSLYELNLNGSDLKVILDAKAGDDYFFASYSGDGKKVVFLYVPKEYMYWTKLPMICTVNADGSNFKEVAEADFKAYPVWSPDGKQIAFASSKGIFVMNEDGSNLFLIQKGYVDRLVWIP